MQNRQHYLSKSVQVLLIGGVAAILGYAIPFNTMVVIPFILVLMMLIYMRIVLESYHKILLFIILVIPFNLKIGVGIPFVNIFNLLWVSYVGIVVLRAVTYSEPILVKSPLTFPILLVVAVFTISCIQAKWVVSPYNFSAMVFPTYQKWVQWLFFYFFCMRGIRNEKQAKQTIIFVTLMVFIAGYFNIKDYMGMASSTKGDNLQRAAGLFGNANASACFFCSFAPTAMGLALARIKDWKMQIYFTVVSLVGVFAVISTYSRNGMATIGLLSCMIIFFCKVNIKVSLVLLTLVFLLASSDNIQKRFSQTSTKDIYGQVKLDYSVLARLTAWSKALYLVKKSPVIGHGFYSFRSISVEKYNDLMLKYHGSTHMATHNGYLNILTGAGIVGMLVFLYFIFSCMKLAWDIFSKTTDPFWKGASIGIFTGMIGLLIFNGSGIRFYDRRGVAYFWILLGALYKGHEYYEARIKSKEQKHRADNSENKIQKHKYIN